MSGTQITLNEGEINDCPLWDYVKIIEKRVGGGGNTVWSCNFCNKVFQGSHYRVRSHLLKIKHGGISVCTAITNEDLTHMRQLVEDVEIRKKNAKPKEIPLHVPSSQVFEMPGGRKNKKVLSPLEKAFNLSQRDELHSEIARLFYTSGLSFNVARNPHYIRAFTLAASRTIPGYLPPGYNLLRTTLLQRERANIEKLLEPMKSAWQEKGVTICSDGWSDPQRRPLVNVMAVCESGPMFLKAIKCEGEYKDKYFISDLIMDAIKEVGCENVVQVVTDNAPVCKAAGLQIEAKYPKIFWTPCVVHTLNLALKNICLPSNTSRNKDAYEQCIWIADVASDASMIKKFIMNHSMRLSMFNSFSKLKLLSVADTRFASTIIMLKRFKELKNSLKLMVINEKWELYKEDDVEKAAAVGLKILDNHFWEQVDYILSLTAPIYDMLRKSDTDLPCLHLVYEWWDEMIEKVRIVIEKHNIQVNDTNSKLFEVVSKILRERWSKSNTPLHCLAHSLNPRYYSSEWLKENNTRVPPHRDIDISRERKKCIERYYSNVDERRGVNEEFASFSAALEDFASHDSMHDRGLMSPTKWWCVHGSSTPTLQKLALKLLGQPCSSSCCERNWSTYTFIQSVKRNKITPQRAEDLVFVHYNLRLLSRGTPQYNEGASKMWDVGGDAFDSMDMEGVALLEFADLSLDEPEFEGVIYSDDGGLAGDEETIPFRFG